MSQNSMVPSGSNTAIQVFGVGAAASAHIVKYLAQYTTEMITAGITGVILEIENTKMTIRLEKKLARANYAIRVRQELALKITRALDHMENHPEIRPEIKEIVMQELYEDLGDMFREVRRELSQGRF